MLAFRILFYLSSALIIHNFITTVLFDKYDGMVNLVS